MRTWKRQEIQRTLIERVRHYQPKGNIWLNVIALGAFLACVASGQTVVTDGYHYGETYTQDVIVQGCNPVEFSNCRFEGPRQQLSSPLGNYAQITVYKCRFRDVGPHSYGQQAAQGIWVAGAQKLWVYDSTFSGLSVGISEDANFGYCDVWISANSFNNNNLRYSDGNGDWLNSSGWGVAVCIMHTRGWNPTDGSWHTIVTGNAFSNRLGIDEPSDQINIYETQNLIVSNNQISGAKGFYGNFAIAANGIVTDDEWSDNPNNNHQPGDYNWTTSGCIIQGNVLTNASIGIWAGHDNQITGNTVRNSGYTATGQPIWIIGIGRFIPEGVEWAQTNTVTGNKVSSVFQGQDNGYNNQAGGTNWSGNTSF